MRIGFTGTRNGMSEAQREQFIDAVGWLWAYCRPHRMEFHHGAAIGADTEAADIIDDTACEIVPHPVKDGQDPLDRNRVIVGNADVLIAAPRTDKEELRSGTWATVRYARAKGIPVIMLSRGKR